MKELKKKLGPLPRWAWILLAGVGFILYRRRQAAAAAAAQNGAATSPTTPPNLNYVPGGQIPISSDGSGGGGSNGSGDTSGLEQILAGLLAQRQDGTPAPQPNVPGSGAKKPTKPRKPKPKQQHQVHKPKSALNDHQKPKAKKRAPAKGGHDTHTASPPKDKVTSKSRPRPPASGWGKAIRQRPTVPLVGHVGQPSQHPPASHAKAKDQPIPNHRPSAPPRRTVRTVTKKGKH